MDYTSVLSPNRIDPSRNAEGFIFHPVVFSPLAQFDPSFHRTVRSKIIFPLWMIVPGSIARRREGCL
jgi:hypothetical protein